MLRSVGAVVNPDVEIGRDLTLEADSEARSTQPPHPSLIVDVPSGYSEDLETFGTPDTIDVTDILCVDVTPLASDVHTTSCPDLSVAKPMSIDPSAYYIIAESGTHQEFRSPSTSVDDVGIGAYSFRNPSLAPNIGPTSLGDTASGGFPLTALGRYTEPDDSLAQTQNRFRHPHYR